VQDLSAQFVEATSYNKLQVIILFPSMRNHQQANQEQREAERSWESESPPIVLLTSILHLGKLPFYFFSFLTFFLLFSFSIDGILLKNKGSCQNPTKRAFSFLFFYFLC